MESKVKPESYCSTLRHSAVLFLLLIFAFALAAAKPVSASAQNNGKISVLFIGNSKTAKNNIPGIFKKIAKANGKNVKVTSVTASGKTLNYIANNKKRKIKAESYDYVVIQEHTRRNTNYTNFLKGAQKIVKYVRQKNPDVNIVVRKIWLLKNSRRSTVQKAYNTVERVAARIGASSVSNDGPAFDLCSQYYPSIQLYEDNRHQTAEGAYLAASCVYASIFEESPVGCSYKGNLSSSVAKKLQKVAAVASGYKNVRCLMQ